MPIEETDSASLLKNSSSDLSTLAKQYCGISPEDIKERDRLKGLMVSIMQPENGWYEWECYWTDEWWKYERATIAPWSISNPKQRKNEAKMIAGIDFFWHFDDIANYINQYDHVRQSKSLKLLRDYTSDEWDINRRIEELVKMPDIFCKKYKFWEMLQSTGWTKISPKGKLKKIIAYDKIIVPKWSELSNDNFSDYGFLQPKIHYFNTESEVLQYLRENGNIEPSRYAELFDDSSSVASGSPPKTPHTPHRAVAEMTDPQGSWQKVRHLDDYLFPSVWTRLYEMGYRQITEKGPLENTLWITPEARQRLEGKINKDIENYQKIDIKLHPVLKAGDDYFVTKNDLLQYVTSRYEDFRKSSHERSIGNDTKNKKVNTKKKVKNNSVSTPTTAFSNVNGGEVDMISKLLISKDCDFDALWNELVKEGWTRNDDKDGTKYLAAWASEMTSDEWTLNREYYIDQDELLKYLRITRKIKIDDGAPRNAIKTECKAKKRGNDADEDLLTSFKKNKHSDPDTIAKLQQTPEDPMLALRYIMREGGKWDNDHQGSSKTGSMMGQLKEMGWEHLTLIGHNDFSAYFTNEAIEMIKEIDNVDSVDATYKVNGKTTLTHLTENEHYFFDKDEIIKYVDIKYCGADISKYPEKSRRNRVKTNAAGIDEKKAKAAVEVKQNSKTVTPKNTKKRKQSENFEPTPGSAASNTSMTSETEEEELQRWIEEKVGFGQIWTFLKQYGWETAYATNEVPNNFWVAPWAKLKEGALKGKSKYDVKKLIQNLDYFVEKQHVCDYILTHGLNQSSDYETITKKNDRAIGNFYDTRRNTMKGIDENDDEGDDGEFGLNDIKNKKVSPRLSHDPHEPEEIERLTSTYHSSPNVDGLYFNGEHSPNAESISAIAESKKRAAERREPESLKKMKIPIEDDIKTIGQAIHLAKDALTTSDVIETNVVGREKQFQQLSESISGALENRSGKGIYVCGSPGGGKTLLVSKVINSLKIEDDDSEESSPGILSTLYNYIQLLGSPSKNTSVAYQIIRIGGTSILNANQFYSKILSELEEDTGSISNHDLKSRVYKKFTNTVVQGKQSPKTPPPMIILVIDEIDRAPTDLVAELFLATAEINSTLILVGIANLVNFPEQGLSGLTEEAMPETIVFEPYTIEQLQEIVRRRLYNLVDDRALNFLASKAFKSGDVRTLIEMASRCVTAAEEKCITEGITMDEILTNPIIDTKLVIKVLKPMQGDLDLETLKKTSHKGLQVLVSLVLASGTGTMTTSDMLNSYNTYLAQKSLPGVSNDEFRTSFEELSNNGFLVTENISGFGGRFNKQGKSHQPKYHMKVTAEKLIKVLKEKDIKMGVSDLENMNKKSDEFDF